MILVTGATGHLGSSVIAHLLEKTEAKEIVAFARDENKANFLKEKGVQVRIGHFDDQTSIEAAMEGVDKVLLVSGLDPNRLAQHKNVIDAAKKANVKQIVYTGVSMTNVKESAISDFLGSHFETEDYIKASGLNYTLLRNTLYTDGIPMFVGEHVFENGIYLPAGQGKVPYALRDEMGEATANILLQNGHENKTYEITGESLYSFEDIANELTSLSGKTVSFTDADGATFPETLKAAGVPEPFVYIVNGFATDIRNKLYEKTSGDLALLLGRKPSNLKTGLQALYKL
ncbi:SDR family oxidoreductase [Marinilongibacter aquaticus]|uniref:SDR family oxidoreductase n=1 Tax=Marinilongibacter aquaticus TaxID=2975157 RepID=UPI0021BDEF5C|nr:SDR family oxidoreductase [Marinilongibacter aquaticus]UBM59543.1 SDR family oxidoreductase [Marinilongibacter aquaticus]